MGSHTSAEAASDNYRVEFDFDFCSPVTFKPYPEEFYKGCPRIRFRRQIKRLQDSISRKASAKIIYKINVTNNWQVTANRPKNQEIYNAGLTP
jgi:hypothetical protein